MREVTVSDISYGRLHVREYVSHDVDLCGVGQTFQTVEDALWNVEGLIKQITAMDEAIPDREYVYVHWER